MSPLPEQVISDLLRVHEGEVMETLTNREQVRDYLLRERRHKTNLRFRVVNVTENLDGTYTSGSTWTSDDGDGVSTTVWKRFNGGNGAFGGTQEHSSPCSNGTWLIVASNIIATHCATVVAEPTAGSTVVDISAIGQGEEHRVSSRVVGEQTGLPARETVSR